ncbi:MAG: DHA2 family efflux MFS transporter permease subunit [Desulfosporosinus sp.]|nr:DHA2 family efflux MFS transporter permease subunit [Desulfosporosinus sp.]
MLTQRKKWLILVVVSLGLFMDLLDMTIVNVAVPKIMIDFGANVNLTQYVLTAYMVTIGIFEPVTAYFADTFGMKKIFIISLLVFTIGSASCAMAWSIHALIGFRIFQAIGGGVIMPLALSIVKKTFSKEELPLAMGLMGIPLILAPALGPTIGGYFVGIHDSWRFIFWVNVPIGILTSYLSYSIIDEFEKTEKKLDLIGFILSSLGFATLFLAVSNGAEAGWTSFEIVSLLVTSAIMLMLFFTIEQTVKEPLIDFRIFRIQAYSAAIFVTFFLMIILFGTLYLLPLFMQQLRNLGAFPTGLILIPEFVGALLTIPLSALLLPRIGAVIPTVTGMIIMIFGTYPFTHLQVITDLHSVELYLFVIGSGLGLAIMPSITLAFSVLPEELVNQGSAVLNLIRQLGSAFGVSILTSVVDQRAPYYMQRIVDQGSAGSNTLLFIYRYQNYFQSFGYNLTQAKQLTITYALSFFEQQASVQAFHDAFGVSMIAAILGVIPAIFLFQKKAKVERSK